MYGQVQGDDWSMASNEFDGFDGVISLPDEYAVGNGRLVGMGFEVNNTTAEIYKQGTVHVFRQAQQQDTFPTWMYRYVSTVRDAAGTGTTNLPLNSAFTGRQLIAWPDSEESVTLLPGTRTWKAADGCYCVVPFESEENPITPAEYVNPILTDEFIQGPIRGAVLNEHDNVFLPPPFSDTADGTAIQGLFWPNKWAPVHSVGAAFTGLSEQTSLTLTVNMYYEYFPTSSDVSLVTLATPSAGFDPVALSLYSEALSSMPVGVPASMNGFGDWFAGIVSKFAIPIGAALSPIFGPAAAGVGAAAAGIANSYLASQSPMTKPAPRRPITQAPMQRPPPRIRSPPPLPARDQAYEKAARRLNKEKRRRKKARRKARATR
jgi:hypothetical protein